MTKTPRKNVTGQLHDLVCAAREILLEATNGDVFEASLLLADLERRALRTRAERIFHQLEDTLSQPAARQQRTDQP